METSLGATFRRNVWRGLVAAGALCVPLSAQAQPQQPPPSGAPAPAPTPPPPGTAPTPDGTPPADGQPPPLAESPLMEGQGTAPPPPAYPDEPPPPPPEPAAEPAPEPDDSPRERSAGPFSKGSIRATALIGTGSSTTDTYLILGAGLGYFLIDGLEVGLDWDIWFLADPVLNRLSPETRYVFHMVPVVKPYIGAFYRHTFVADYDDFDYIGGRIGAYIIPSGGRTFVGAGAVYEHMLSCEDNWFIDCDDVYPEISIGVAF